MIIILLENYRKQKLWICLINTYFKIIYYLKNKTMNIKRLYINIIFLFIYLLSFSQAIDSSFFINTAFEGGEKLQYKVKYGIINGGKATLVINIIPSGYSYLYHIKALARTTGAVGTMVKIRDVYESYVEIHSGFPVKSIRNIYENKYTSYNEVLFFRDSNYVQSLKSGIHRVPPNVLDILSAFYYARRYLFKNGIKKNNIITLNTFFDDELLPIKLKFKEKEKIKTKFGKISCLRFVPLLGKKSPFKKEEDMQIWVTADNNFIPVKIRVKLPIGKLKCDIINFSNIKNKNGVLKK